MKKWIIILVIILVLIVGIIVGFYYSKISSEPKTKFQAIISQNEWNNLVTSDFSATYFCEQKFKEISGNFDIKMKYCSITSFGKGTTIKLESGVYLFCECNY